jgi:type II secretory pathway pseudopilin PulG
MEQFHRTNERGFSLVELFIAMTVTLILLSGIGVLLANSLSTRSRENTRTEALVAAQGALNIMSREIANSGWGLNDNGIVFINSNANQLRIRANLNNTNLTTDTTDDESEDVTYAYDAQNQAIIRYDRNTATSTILASGITQLNFGYSDYKVQNSGTVLIQPFGAAATVDTCKVRITISIALKKTGNQPDSTITLTNEVSLRNASFLLKGY